MVNKRIKTRVVSTRPFNTNMSVMRKLTKARDPLWVAAQSQTKRK